MRPRLAYLLSACIHLGLFWLMAAASDAWTPVHAVRSGRSAVALSQAARARPTPDRLDSRMSLQPAEPVSVEVATTQPQPPEPQWPATPANADERLVLRPPVEELLRRRTTRSVAVAVAPFAEPVSSVRPETVPEVDGRAVPPLDWGAIPEQELPTLNHLPSETPLLEHRPMPTPPIADPGDAPQDAIGANVPAGAQLDQNPQKLPANPEPVYPEELRLARIGGRVLLRVIVRPDGLVESVRVEESSGHSALDASALAAVQQWKFAPARRAGLPARVEVRVPISFAIRDSAR